jgi:hypothetical protein
MKTIKDVNGVEIKVGSKVRILRIPDGIETMPEETVSLFSNSIGSRFIVYEIDEFGCSWVDLGTPRGDTVSFEPYCLEVVK